MGAQGILSRTVRAFNTLSKKTRRKEESKPEAGDQNNELEQTSTMVYTEVYCFTKH